MAELIKAWRQAAHDFRFAWRALVATDILYKALATAVLLPGVAAALRAFLHFSGSEVHADQDILLFFLSPLGIITLVVITGAIIAVGALELSCLLTIAITAREQRRITVLSALGFALAKIWPIQRLTMRLVTRVLVIAAPFLVCAGLFVWWLLSEHDINYYLSYRPPEFLTVVAIVGVLLLLMTFLLVRRLIGWVYVLPLVLFEGIDARAAFATSEARATDHWRGLVIIVVSWIAALLLVSTLLLGTVRLVGIGAATLFADNVPALVASLGSVLFVWFLANLAVQLFASCFLALLLACVYGSWGQAKAMTTQVPIDLPSRGPYGWISVKALWLVLGVAGVGAVGAGIALLDSIETDQRTVVIAHRGASGDAPENTLAAVEEAISQRADWVEIDVQETADGAVVVAHDSDFMKVAGVATRIWDGNYEELSQIDIGSWFDPRYADQRLPTLEQVLELAKGRVGITIELKYYGHDQRLEARVVEIVESMDMTNDVEVMSLKYDAVRKMRELRPNWTLGLLTARALGDLSTADADFLAVNSAMASEAFIRTAKASGKQVYVWTVNDLASMARMISRGADGLITDHPGLAQQLLERRRNLSSVERLLMDLALQIGIDVETADIVAETGTTRDHTEPTVRP